MNEVIHRDDGLVDDMWQATFFWQGQEIVSRCPKTFHSRDRFSHDMINLRNRGVPIGTPIVRRQLLAYVPPKTGEW